MLTLSQFTEKYNIVLNPQQLRAVSTTGTPLLVLSVPGSGKTTVVAAHIAYLIYCCGVDPSRILALTFNKSAKEELRKRIREKYEIRDLPRSIGQTIHSYCRDIYVPVYGNQPIESNLENRVGSVWKQCYGEWPDTAQKQMAVACITAYKNNMWTEDEMAANAEYKEVWPVCKALLTTLKKEKKIVIDDYLVGAYEALRSNPEVLKEQQNRFSCICVDEAQDNSKIQNAILDLIGENIKDQFYVGDDDQSIYRFRCAYPQALRDFTERKAKLGAQRMVMSINYRSTPEIVKAATNLISHNPDYYNKDMQSAVKSGLPVEYKTFRNHFEQYYWIADFIQNEAHSSKSVCVLFRDNDSAIPLVDVLSLLDMKFRVNRSISSSSDKSDGVSSIMTSGMARGFAASIEFLCNPDGPSNGYLFEKFYSYFGLMIKKAQVQKTAGYIFYRGRNGEKICALNAFLGQHNMSWNNQKRLGHLIDFAESASQMPAMQLVEDIFSDLGFGFGQEDTESTLLIKDIFLSVSRSARDVFELNSRLKQLNNIYLQSLCNHNSNVILSTVHSAKGLEYDTVVLMDLMNGSFPKNLADKDSVIEDRNLAYVAATRAKSKLVVCEYDDFESLYVSEMKNPN